MLILNRAWSVRATRAVRATCYAYVYLPCALCVLFAVRVVCCACYLLFVMCFLFDMRAVRSICYECCACYLLCVLCVLLAMRALRVTCDV